MLFFLCLEWPCIDAYITVQYVFFFSLFVEEQICCMKTPQHSRAYKNINLNKKLPKDGTKYKLFI